MKKHTWYYNQIVTETEMNEEATWAQDAEKNLARDIAEYGVFSGLNVSPTGPATTSVVVAAGVGRDRNSGSRMELQLAQNVACDQDEFGNPTYTDLLPGEGRWCSIYVRPKVVDSDLRTDGHGFPVWFTQTESLEFFLHVGIKGAVAFKATLARPGLLTTAVMLSDIWFEAGATAIDLADLDVTRREDYYRADVSGVSIVAGSPKAGLQQLGAIVATIPVNLADADLPTGANDGAHQIGLGGHATENEWQWEGARQLDAAGDDVHEVVQKIVSDLGRLETQGVPGSRLVSAGGVTETWANGDTVDAGVYDDSVGGYLAGIVKDLAGVEGGLRVGGDSSVGAPYSLTAVSLQGHDEELLVGLNDHVNTSGHPVDAISHPVTTSTFADARVLAANQGINRWNELVNILGEKPVGAGTSGDQAIGCCPAQAVRPFPSPVAETLSVAGNQTLNQRSARLLYEILGRMRYNGDDRLTGTFQPENDLGANLGALLKRFQNAYVETVRGGTLGVVGSGQTRLESTGAATPAQVKAEQDVILDANFSDLTGGVIRARLGNVEQMRLSKIALLPKGSGKFVGDAVDRWGQGYFQTKVDFSTPTIRVQYLNAIGSFINNPASAQPLYALNGEYLYNGAAVAYEVYARLDFLKPGDLLQAVRCDWMPTALGNMDANVFRQPWTAGPVGSLATINPVLVARHSAGAILAHTVEDGYYYYVRVYGAGVANQRLYGMRVEYYVYTLPV